MCEGLETVLVQTKHSELKCCLATTVTNTTLASLLQAPLRLPLPFCSNPPPTTVQPKLAYFPFLLKNGYPLLGTWLRLLPNNTMLSFNTSLTALRLLLKAGKRQITTSSCLMVCQRNVGPQLREATKGRT